MDQGNATLASVEVGIWTVMRSMCTIHDDPPSFPTCPARAKNAVHLEKLSSTVMWNFP